MIAASSASNALLADAVTSPSTSAVNVAIIAIDSRTTSFDSELSVVIGQSRSDEEPDTSEPPTLHPNAIIAIARALNSAFSL